jgi:hypothetical protein
MSRLCGKKKLNFATILSVFIVLVSAQVSLAKEPIPAEAKRLLKDKEYMEKLNTNLLEYKDQNLNYEGFKDDAHVYSIKAERAAYSPPQNTIESLLQDFQIYKLKKTGKMFRVDILDDDKTLLALIDKKMELVLFRGKQYPVNYDFNKTYDMRYITGKQQAKYCEYMKKKKGISWYSDSYFDSKNNKHYFVFKKPEGGYFKYMEESFKDDILCEFLVAKVRKGIDIEAYVIEEKTKKVIAQYTKDGFKKFYTATRKGRY